MRHFSSVMAAAIFILCSSPASAGLFDLLPKVNVGGKSVDVGSIATNLTGAVREPSEAEEIRMGQEFAATLLGAKPLLNDARVQRYVNTLGRWIAMQSERPDLPWVFGVLDDQGYNAFATPGGHIFVTNGLLKRMNNEAELAGVLAHEIAHVLKKHHLRAVQKNSGFALVGDLVSTQSGGNAAAKTAFLNIGKKLYSSGLNKDDEFEADRVGVVLAARAGYDAYGLPSVLQALQGQKPGDGDFSLMFATHPTPTARIEMLGKLMNTQFDSLHSSTGHPLPARLTEFEKK